MKTWSILPKLTYDGSVAGSKTAGEIHSAAEVQRKLNEDNQLKYNKTWEHLAIRKVAPWFIEFRQLFDVFPHICRLKTPLESEPLARFSWILNLIPHNRKNKYAHEKSSVWRHAILNSTITLESYIKTHDRFVLRSSTWSFPVEPDLTPPDVQSIVEIYCTRREHRATTCSDVHFTINRKLTNKKRTENMSSLVLP